MSKGKNKTNAYGGVRALRDQIRGKRRYNPLREGKKSDRMYWTELKVAVDGICTKIDDVNQEVERMVNAKELLEKIKGLPQETILKNMVNHFRHDMKAALDDLSEISLEIKPLKGWASGITEIAEYSKIYNRLVRIRDTFALLAQPNMVAITTLMSSVTLPKEEQEGALVDIEEARENIELVRNDIIAKHQEQDAKAAELAGENEANESV